MTVRFWQRRRALAGAALGTGLALLFAALALVVATAGLPSAWWPQTGQAFAASPSSTVTATTARAQSKRGETVTPNVPKGDEAACDAIVGPAHSYCLGSRSADALPTQGHLSVTASWTLGALAAGLTALLIVNRRRGL